MKILFYNHTGQVGGAERLLLMLLERLDQSQFTPVLVCPEEGPLHRLANETGVRVETIAGLNARFTWRIDHLVRYLNSFRQVIRKLRQKVIDAQPDLIHANSVRAGLVATLATFGLKQTVVWHIHDLLPRHPFNIFIRAVAMLSRRTRIIAVAQASADRLMASHNDLRRRTVVIPNAVDFDSFAARLRTASGRDRVKKPAGSDRRPDPVATAPGTDIALERIRRELQIKEHDPVIGMIGRLTPAKGQLEMLKLFPKVLGRFPNARLLIVGAPAFNNEHEYLQLLKQIIAAMDISDRVHLLGARDDVAEILRSLDLLVVNSASEACSLVILEAMASGTPVLATSTGGTPEIIEHQKNGWLVTFGNGEELASGVMTMLGDKEMRERLGWQGQKDASVRYTIPRFMSEMQGFYRAVLAKGETPHQENIGRFKVSLTSD